MVEKLATSHCKRKAKHEMKLQVK